MPAADRSLARFAAPGIFILALGACAPADAPVARVNGEAISRAELEAQLRVFQSRHPGLPINAAVRRRVLERMIDQVLLVQAARREGFDGPAARDRIAALRKAQRAELERGIAHLKERLAHLDRSVETQVLVEALSQARRPGITVTAQDLREAYAARAAGEILPPLEQIRDALLEEVLFERLAEAERGRAKVEIREEALR
jgi:hypothetical protein